MIEYILVRSRRKTIAIHILKDASVEVRAPLRAPKGAIDKFVVSKHDWILENIERRRGIIAEKNTFALDYGKTAILLGEKYPIEGCAERIPRFDGERFLIPGGLAPDGIKDAVLRIYKEKAREILIFGTERFSAEMGVTPRSVKVTSAKTRWGSCSTKGNICFSWRLIMADAGTVDYVIVHELAHILEHNHSPRFWALVKKVIPDYAERRQKLKVLNQTLLRENWD